jgi:hypothetical protein
MGHSDIQKRKGSLLRVPLPIARTATFGSLETLLRFKEHDAVAIPEAESGKRKERSRHAPLLTLEGVGRRRSSFSR